MLCESKRSPIMSKKMIELYGFSEATKVYSRCQALDDFFNYWVQNEIYDELWARPELSIAEKSLLTIVSLAALGKEAQLSILLKGFLNLGKSPEV